MPANSPPRFAMFSAPSCVSNLLIISVATCTLWFSGIACNALPIFGTWFAIIATAFLLLSSSGIPIDVRIPVATVTGFAVEIPAPIIPPLELSPIVLRSQTGNVPVPKYF